MTLSKARISTHKRMIPITLFEHFLSAKPIEYNSEVAWINPTFFDFPIVLLELRCRNKPQRHAQSRSSSESNKAAAEP